MNCILEESNGQQMINQTNITELISWLETDEAASRKGRADRLSHLLQVVQLPEDGILFRGETSLRSFLEIRLCYIHGLYLATILLSLACIEWEIAGRLYEEGWKKAKGATLEKLLLKAHKRDILSDAELITFQHLRKIRNSQAHFRPPLSESTLTRRAVDRNVLPDDVLMADAQQAIEALGSFLGRRMGLF